MKKNILYFIITILIVYVIFYGIFAFIEGKLFNPLYLLNDSAGRALILFVTAIGAGVGGAVVAANES